MTDIPDYLRQISSGEETESTSYEERDRNRHIIPQVDGTIDSRDSLNQTLDSIDLTISPVRYRNAQRDTGMTVEDINDDTHETVKFNKGRATKVYEINTEKKKLHSVPNNSKF